jgi:DNA-binding NarL/FixJ family response regulator
MAVRILIVDDDPTIRMLVARLLRRQSGWEPCGEASNGAEAIEKVKELAPDVVIMDLGMPVMTGLQAARTIAQSHPRLPMLMMSVQEVSTTLAKEARHAGYRGAVTKSSGNEIVRGVEALLRHNTFFYAEDEIGESRSKSELSH